MVKSVDYMRNDPTSLREVPGDVLFLVLLRERPICHLPFRSNIVLYLFSELFTMSFPKTTFTKFT